MIRLRLSVIMLNMADNSSARFSFTVSLTTPFFMSIIIASAPITCSEKHSTSRHHHQQHHRHLFRSSYAVGGSVAEWLARWTQAHRRARVQIAAATLSRNSLRQTVHTHCASVHQAAKFVAALLRITRVTAGLAESNGSLPPGL